MAFHKLTNKQRMFLAHYLVSFNAADAARKAGYNSAQPATAGAEVLKSARIKAAISQRLNALQADADEVLVRLTSQARADMGDFLTDAGGFSITEARAKQLTHLIKKFKKTTVTVRPPRGDPIETSTIELELYDAQQATVQLAHILGLYRNQENDALRDRLREYLRANGKDPDEVIAKAAALLGAPTALPVATEAVVEGDYTDVEEAG